MRDLIRKVLREELEIEPSTRVVNSICDAEKFCKAQGPITFGQLRTIVESAIKERLGKHIGEGGFKAILRLIPWFLPQLALAGMSAAVLRAINKILKPTLTETQSYKTWWGKTVLKMMEAAEGDLPLSDPFTRTFFISDGLMTLMDEENKVKFARYIAELTSTKPDNEPVPDLFVENELRSWINKRFLLDPPLEPKMVKENTEDNKIEIIYKILKRIIPDNSVFTSSYDMPYASTGRVDVYMEYSLNPKTNIWYSTNDSYGVDYEGTIYLTIDKLLYKGPHDREYEVVLSYYHIPEYIYEELEGYLSDKIRKTISNLSVDFDYEYQLDKD
jgi:hypothetical protein